MARNEISFKLKNEVLSVVIFLVLFAGLVSANDVGYKERFSESLDSGGYGVVSRTTWVYYNNKDRHSSYDYRHGYSYRATREYFDDKYNYGGENYYDGYRGDGFREASSLVYGNRYGLGYRYTDSGVKGYSYEYVPYLRGFKRRECYLAPPSNKLFYFKC